jgi:hypothetical protein
MKTKYWSVSSAILEGGPRKPELLPKPTLEASLKERGDRVDAARTELELKKKTLGVASEGNASRIQTVKGKAKKRRKESVRVPRGLDWHVLNNDK